MAREYVTSTSVEWIDQDASAQTREIAFASGGVYRYCDVPTVVGDELRAAESPLRERGSEEAPPLDAAYGAALERAQVGFRAPTGTIAGRSTHRHWRSRR